MLETLRFFSVLMWLHHIMSADFPAAQSPVGGSTGLSSGVWGDHWGSLSCSWSQFDFYCVTRCIIVLGVDIRRWWTVAIKRPAHGQQQYSYRLWHSHHDRFVLRDPECVWKLCTVTPPARALDTEWLESMVSCETEPCPCLSRNPEPWDQAGFLQSSTVHTLACVHWSPIHQFIPDTSGSLLMLEHADFKVELYTSSAPSLISKMFPSAELPFT